MENEEIITRLAAVEQRTVSNTRRIDKLEQSNQALLEMAGSVRVLCYQMEQSNKKIDNIETQICTIKDAPSRVYNKIIWIIITAAATAIAGAVITYLLK